MLDLLSCLSVYVYIFKVMPIMCTHYVASLPTFVWVFVCVCV